MAALAAIAIPLAERRWRNSASRASLPATRADGAPAALSATRWKYFGDKHATHRARDAMVGSRVCGRAGNRAGAARAGSSRGVSRGRGVRLGALCGRRARGSSTRGASYRNLASEVARRPFSATRPVGDFDYYERMEKFVGEWCLRRESPAATSTRSPTRRLRTARSGCSRGRRSGRTRRCRHRARSTEYKFAENVLSRASGWSRLSLVVEQRAARVRGVPANDSAEQQRVSQLARGSRARDREPRAQHRRRVHHRSAPPPGGCQWPALRGHRFVPVRAATLRQMTLGTLAASTDDPGRCVDADSRDAAHRPSPFDFVPSHR